MTLVQVAGGSVLCGALERDDRQMSAATVVADREMERDSGLTADGSLRRSAWEPAAKRMGNGAATGGAVRSGTWQAGRECGPDSLPVNPGRPEFEPITWAST